MLKTSISDLKLEEIKKIIYKIKTIIYSNYKN